MALLLLQSRSRIRPVVYDLQCCSGVESGKTTAEPKSVRLWDAWLSVMLAGRPAL